MTLRRIAPELAQQGTDFGREGGRWGARELHRDVQFLLVAVGVELDIRLAAGDRRQHTPLADRGHPASRTLEPGRSGAIVERSVGQLSRDHDALRRPLAGQHEISRGRLNPGELELRLLGEGQNRQGDQQGKGAPAAHAYSLGLVRNMAIASISTSSSGRQRIAWIPVEAGTGSSSCWRKNSRSEERRVGK